MDKILKALAMLASAGDDLVTWGMIEREGYTRGEWANVIMPALALAGYEYVGGDGGWRLMGGPGI